MKNTGGAAPALQDPTAQLATTLRHAHANLPSPRDRTSPFVPLLHESHATPIVMARRDNSRRGERHEKKRVNYPAESTGVGSRAALDLCPVSSDGEAPGAFLLAPRRAGNVDPVAPNESHRNR